MAIAHVCTGCGFDLAKHRAVIDPRYGLPLVDCVRCGRSEVRRRHPIQRSWRTFLRMLKSLLAGAAQSVLLLLFAWLTILSAYGHADLVSLRRIALLDEFRLTFAALGLIVLPVLIGAWLGSTLAHWPRKTQWFGWAGIVLALGWMAPVIYHGLMRLQYGTVAWPPWVEWRNSLIVFAFMWTISFAGLPLGHLVRRAAATNAQQRWRKRRIRLRRLRTSA